LIKTTYYDTQGNFHVWNNQAPLKHKMIQ
jgi:hypothetical protein